MLMMAGKYLMMILRKSLPKVSINFVRQIHSKLQAAECHLGKNWSSLGCVCGGRGEGCPHNHVFFGFVVCRH